VATKSKHKDPVAAVKKEVKALKKEVGDLRDALNRATKSLKVTTEDLEVCKDTVFRLRRILLRKEIIFTGDLTYEYLKEENKKTGDRNKFTEQDLRERK